MKFHTKYNTSFSHRVQQPKYTSCTLWLASSNPYNPFYRLKVGEAKPKNFQKDSRMQHKTRSSDRLVGSTQGAPRAS